MTLSILLLIKGQSQYGQGDFVNITVFQATCTCYYLGSLFYKNVIRKYLPSGKEYICILKEWHSPKRVTFSTAFEWQVYIYRKTELKINLCRRWNIWLSLKPSIGLLTIFKSYLSYFISEIFFSRFIHQSNLELNSTFWTIAILPCHSHSIARKQLISLVRETRRIICPLRETNFIPWYHVTPDVTPTITLII